MSENQTIGAAILVFCVIVALAYAVAVIFPVPVAQLLGRTADANTCITFRLYSVLVPVFTGFVGIQNIGAWIGWTMATTPAPKPIEEITAPAEPENKPATT